MTQRRSSVPSVPAPRPAPRRPGLVPTDVAASLSAVLSTAVGAIRQHEQGTRAGGDIEHVHQMRVATRRIRAYLKAAAPALEAGAVSRLRTDLSGLAHALGRVRDLDVMMEQMQDEATALGPPDAEPLQRLIGRLASDRQAARSSLIAELDHRRFAALLAELDRTAARPPVADPWADLTQLAGRQWDRLARARASLVTKFGDDPPDDDLHALRILGKRARYSAELLAGGSGRNRRRRSAPGSTGGPAIQQFLVALAEFQEVLGRHQDGSVLEDRLREMVAADDGSDVGAALAAGRVIEGCRQRCAEARAAYPAAWKAVARTAGKAFS